VGFPRVKIAVADAGPLIHLDEIRALTLLCLFEALHIPDAVWEETVGKGRVTPENLKRLRNISRHSLDRESVRSFIRERRLYHLQAGEIECLYLCLEKGIPVLLTDDLAVRDAAKRMGVTPVGSLGVVVKAYRSGLISLEEAGQKIKELYEVSSLFVTRAIVEIAIEQLYKKAR